MKKTSSFILLVAICASLAMLTACEYDIVVPEKIAPPPPGGDSISFAQDVIPVFNESCNASCHKTGGIAPDLSAANAYTALMSGNYVVAEQPDNSELYTKCKPGATMASYTSAEQLALMRRWILAGAKNN